jgi:hypothetical protein
MRCIFIAELQDPNQTLMRSRRSLAGKRGRGQRKAVMPRVGHPIPIMIALKKNPAEVDGPTQHIVAAYELSIHVGSGINAHVDFDRR